MTTSRSGPEYRAHVKRQVYLRKQGVYTFVPNAPMIKHLRHLTTQIGVNEIARRANVPRTTISAHLNGQADNIDRATYDKVMRVRLEPGDRITSSHRGLGAQRIINGLGARGFTHASLQPFSLNTVKAITALAADGGYRSVTEPVYDAFLAMAEKLDAASPLDHGVSVYAMRHCQSKARTNGHAPLACWDLDTIHLPESIPEWTGACGTHRGYFLHLKYSIRVDTIGKRRTVLCEPCLTAKTAYVREHERRARCVEYEEIMRLQDEESMSQQDIAEVFDVSRRTITRIVKEGPR